MIMLLPLAFTEADLHRERECCLVSMPSGALAMLPWLVTFLQEGDSGFELVPTTVSAVKDTLSMGLCTCSGDNYNLTEVTIKGNCNSITRVMVKQRLGKTGFW